MVSVVKQTKVKRENGFLYFLDKDGDVSRVKRGQKKQEKVKKTNVKREKGFLYFIDKDGNVARSKMKRS